MFKILSSIELITGTKSDSFSKKKRCQSSSSQHAKLMHLICPQWCAAKQEYDPVTINDGDIKTLNKLNTSSVS